MDEKSDEARFIIDKELSMGQMSEVQEDEDEALVRPQSLWLKVVARVLILVLILGMGLSFVQYRARNQVTFGDFTLKQGDYYYEDAYFEIISYDYLDDLNLKAINDLYYKYEDILDMMGHSAMPQIQLRFYGDRDAYLEGGIPAGYVGYYRNGVIRVLNPEAKEVEYYQDYGDAYTPYSYIHSLLPHEFVHAVHEDMMGAFPVNKWISEGIANYISYKLIGINWYGIKASYKDQPIKPQNFNAFDDGYEYEYGFTIIDYLVETYDEGIIPLLLEEPALEEEARIMKITHMTPEEFYGAWESYMIESYEMLPSQP